MKLHTTLPVTIEGVEVETTPVFNAYWYFAAERQRIFFHRLKPSADAAYTEDRVLIQYKFTNAYRASDRVSQYLIRNVIYRDDLPQCDEEVFFRILLFKLFNKIETWELIQEAIGTISLENYEFQLFDSVLSQSMSNGERIYSAAYIMPSCGNVFGYKKKHQNHLRLLEYMLTERFPARIRASTSMDEAYTLLRTAPSIGPFLAYQFLTDLNYSELLEFSESEFVVAGPGSIDGISKCFKDLGSVTAEEVIKFMYDSQSYFFAKLGIDFQSLWGRPLQLIDCQNIFCEISKYARIVFPDLSGISGRKRIKQKFSRGRTLPLPWYPPKWNINSEIQLGNFESESPASEMARDVQLMLL